MKLLSGGLLYDFYFRRLIVALRCADLK
jgi:hypothetical protein